MCVQLLICVWLSVAPWTEACQPPLSMEFSRQEYWSGLPFPTIGDVPDPEIKPISLVPPALADRFCTTGSTWEYPEKVKKQMTGCAVWLESRAGLLRATFAQGLNGFSSALHVTTGV